VPVFSLAAARTVLGEQVEACRNRAFIGRLVLVPLLALLRQSSERSRKVEQEVKMKDKHVVNRSNRKAKSTIRTFDSYMKEAIWAGGAELLATPLAS
jgi:hypothetical protein